MKINYVICLLVIITFFLVITGFTKKESIIIGEWTSESKGYTILLFMKDQTGLQMHSNEFHDINRSIGEPKVNDARFTWKFIDNNKIKVVFESGNVEPFVILNDAIYNISNRTGDTTKYYKTVK